MKRIFIILLLLAGCAAFEPDRRMPELPEIYVGTTGLQVSINPASTKEVLMCKDVNVFIDVFNLGAFPDENGKLNGKYAFIVEEQWLKPLNDKTGTIEVKGRSQYNPRGELQKIRFQLTNEGRGLPPQLETYDSPVIFQVCYPYQTLASVPICIDPDIQNLNPRKVCRSQPLQLQGGQGAPVEVTRVETRMVPEGDEVKPYVALYIRNAGRGKVIKPEAATAACGPRAGDLSAEVSVNVQLQGVQLDCQQIVRLEKNEEAKIICTGTQSFGIGAGTFSSVLSIQLDYGYIDTVVLPVTITRLPGQVCGP